MLRDLSVTNSPRVMKAEVSSELMSGTLGRAAWKRSYSWIW